MTPLVITAAGLAAAGAALAVQPAHRQGPVTATVASVAPVAALLVVLVGAARWGETAFQPRHGLLVVTVGAIGFAVTRAVRRATRAREAERRRRGVVDFCEALLGELRAGQAVRAALERSTVAWPEAAELVTTVRLDADVAAALRRLARRPGAESLERLAAAWDLCATTGTGLAFAVEQVMETIQVSWSVARVLQAELASARATARLLALLPVVVLLGAQGLGSRPWHFLVGSHLGLLCLATGAALALCGLWWIDRIGEASARGGT